MFSDKDQSLQNSIEEKNQLNLCSVCGYQKGKNNYGAFTCSSCKVFFRRNAHMDLVCLHLIKIFFFNCFLNRIKINVNIKDNVKLILRVEKLVEFVELRNV